MISSECMPCLTWSLRSSSKKKIRTPKYAASGVIFACGCSRALLPRLCVRGVETLFPASVTLLPPSPRRRPGSPPAPAPPPHRPLFETRSHNYALSAAARILLPAFHIQILLGAPVGPVGASCYVARHLLVVAPDLADDIVEGIVDVDTRLGGRLDEFAAE